MEPVPKNHAWLEQASISYLGEMLSRGEITSAELVLAYLDRIALYDKEGPRLNSVLEINPDAYHIACALDRERQTRGPRGPLFGIPVMVKDNIDTADKMHTSAGSLALADSYAREDSFLVSQLRKAGAVILGKTNMTEWANFMAFEMPPGYSSRGGQVLNPYRPGESHPGGSSSGSGAAVAASLCTAAVGTETSGSILSPASSNSVVGIKPTVGLVSRRGIIPIMHSQDTAGPLARTVADAAILLGALAAPDDADPVTLASMGLAPRDYSVCLDAGALSGARIGVPRDGHEKLDGQHLSIFETALDVLRREGAHLVDPAPMPSLTMKYDRTSMLAEFKPALNAYLGRLSPTVPVHTLKELIAFNNADPGRMLRYGQGLLIQAEAMSGTLTEPQYIRSRAKDLRMSREQGIDQVLREHALDAIVLPGWYGCSVAAKAGYPSVCVPGGYTTHGEPFGITFTAGAFSEPVLIGLAYAFEQATKFRVPPKLA